MRANVNITRKGIFDLMFERPIHLNRRGSFILRYNDIGDEGISVIMRNLGKHISFGAAHRLSNISQYLSRIRWAQLVEKDYRNDLSDHS